MAELERKIGQQAVEIDFEGVFTAHRRTADAAGIEWKSAVYRKIGEEVSARRRLTIERMVELARASRAGFYRFDEDTKPDRDMDPRDAIQGDCSPSGSRSLPRSTRSISSCSWRT